MDDFLVVMRVSLNSLSTCLLAQRNQRNRMHAQSCPNLAAAASALLLLPLLTDCRS